MANPYLSPYAASTLVNPNQGVLQPASSGTQPQQHQQAQPSTSNPFLNLGSKVVSNKLQGGFLGNISNSVNSAVGNSSLGGYLGFSPAANVYTSAGALPWQTAGSVANPALAGTQGVAAGTTFTSALGAVGLGAAGGALLNDLTGGNQTTGSIGGGIGAGIGMAAGGPVGAAIGGTLGSLVGGMFGNDEPKMNASVFNLTFDANNSKGKDFHWKTSGVGSKGIGTDVAQQVMDDYGAYARMLNDDLGIDMTKTRAAGGYNDKYEGGFYIRTQITRHDAYGMGEHTEKFDFNDPNSKLKAYQTVAMKELEALGRLTPEAKEKILGFNPYAQKNTPSDMLGGILGKEPTVGSMPYQAPQETFEGFLQKRHQA